HRRRRRGSDGAGRVERRRLARARNVGHVRHRLRRSSRSSSSADAGGLGRTSRSQGLPGADSQGGADLRAARSERIGVQGEHRARSREASELMTGLRTETMTVNMGAQHPSTHGVLRLVLELDGEVIKSVMPTIGYLHTGIEKTAEQKKWQQVIPLVERMDYLAAHSNSMAFCLSAEKLLRLEIPERRPWHQ